MSLFPLGVVFSFVGLVLAYFLEIVHLGFYKRPELLNSRLCKFFVNNFILFIMTEPGRILVLPLSFVSNIETIFGLWENFDFLDLRFFSLTHSILFIHQI